MPMKIGENIAFLRKGKGLTQDELANMLMVSNQAVSKWESGKCYPDIELLPQLADAFDVTIDRLLLGECMSKSNETSDNASLLLVQAMKIVQDEQIIYTALLQRRLAIGYAKAKKIINDMYQAGYIIKDTAGRYRYLYNGDPNG